MNSKKITTNWNLWDIFHKLPDNINTDISQLIYSFIPEYRNDLLILDCGIGTGVVTLPILSYLREQILTPVNLLGVDKNVEKLEIFQNKIDIPSEYIAILKIDVETRKFSLFNKNQFDVCLSIWFLHYIKDQIKFIHTVSKIIKPKGIFVYGRSSEDLPFLTGQCREYELINCVSKRNLYRIIHKMLDTTGKRIITDIEIPDVFIEKERRNFIWEVTFSLKEIEFIYTERLIAKNIIDSVEDKEFQLFLHELENTFEMNIDFKFKFGVEIIIYENSRDN